MRHLERVPADENRRNRVSLVSFHVHLAASIMTSGYQRLRVRGGESEPEQQTWVADGTAPYPAWKYGGSMLVKSWRILIEASLVVIILILAFAPSQFPDRTATLVSLPTMPPCRTSLSKNCPGRF